MMIDNFTTDVTLTNWWLVYQRRMFSEWIVWWTRPRLEDSYYSSTGQSMTVLSVVSHKRDHRGYGAGCRYSCYTTSSHGATCRYRNDSCWAQVARVVYQRHSSIHIQAGSITMTIAWNKCQNLLRRGLSCSRCCRVDLMWRILCHSWDCSHQSCARLNSGEIKGLLPCIISLHMRHISLWLLSWVISSFLSSNSSVGPVQDRCVVGFSILERTLVKDSVGRSIMSQQ